MSDSKSAAYQNQLEQAAAFIRTNDRFLVAAHVNPDGDATSSTLAVGHILNQLGKSFTMINEGAIPRKFGILEGYSDILDYSRLSQDQSPQFDCVISVDCADYCRIGAVRSLFGDHIDLLNIDHHPTNDGFGTVPLIQPHAASTTEVLYDLVRSLGIAWTRPLAECIYTGLLTDTGGFRYSNTTPKVMAIASEMLEYGVSGNHLADRFLERLTFSQVIILQKALSTLSFSDDKRIGWLSITLDDIRESGAENEDMDGLVNYPRNIEGVEVGILFKQVDDRSVKVSLRSAGKVDVARIAQSFGGGGHIRAAGCKMEGTLNETVAKVVREVGLALA